MTTTRYTVEPEPARQLPSGRPALTLFQVVDTLTGERSLPAALPFCERRAAQLNGERVSCWDRVAS